MDVLCESVPNEDDCGTRYSSSSSEDDERMDQGVAMTYMTLDSILNDNSRMFEFLRSFGVLANKYVCATCRKPMSCVKVGTNRCGDGLMWRCAKDKVWRSVRKGTWFEKSKIKLKSIVLLTYCFCMRKSVQSTCRITGLSDKTVVDWFLSCREICSALMKKRGKIGGPGVVVEFGESSFGSNKYDKGRWVAEVWVWGAVVCGKDHGELVLNVVEKRDARTLQWFIEEHVENGTVIYSDKWDSYEDAEEFDLQSFAADHNYQFRNKVTGTMERYWKEVKRVLKGGKRRRSGLQSHLDEYIWRESVFVHGCAFHSFMQSVGALYVPRVED
ncbi:uncharacterized protein LOC124553891 [Schistocerca americana]|uniref:uncharacterized protein LOC124553891 n=1 Tax=Schistocerca americana TaxID=7009 RepID=UPI001F4F5662|nr:uncharacterized protein LOC124553891 [Schistocerca americana]XP_046983864.1 uncharacterized protein LOC124553891 [Schistocerca americana]